MRCLLFALLFALLVACGGASGPRDTTPDPQPEDAGVASVPDAAPAEVPEDALEGPEDALWAQLVGADAVALFEGVPLPNARVVEGGEARLGRPAIPEALASLPYGPRSGDLAALPEGSPLGSAREEASAALVRAFQCERLAATGLGPGERSCAE
ncbi:MAG: hypothetical protein AAGH15_08365, partial [Myxococcota bacterium]